MTRRRLRSLSKLTIATSDSTLLTFGSVREITRCYVLGLQVRRRFVTLSLLLLRTLVSLYRQLL